MSSVRKVFLSSTYTDLKDYREVVYKAIEGLDEYHCVRMEEGFGARDSLPEDFVREKVAECDVLVGVVGHLYGSCPIDSSQSFTVIEYDAAVDGSKPRLIFLSREDFPVPADLIESEEKQAKQRAFRERVSSERIRDTFSSPDDLAWRVVKAICNWEQTAAQQRGVTSAAQVLRPLPPQPYFAHSYPLQQHFTGRVRERRMLTEWLTSGQHPVFALVAIGGMGKSALTWAWLQRDVLGLPLPGQSEDSAEVAEACRVPESGRPQGALWWSFYEREAGFATFLDEALTYCSGGSLDPATIPSAYDKVKSLVNLLQQHRFLLVLDGFERELRAYASLNAAYQGDILPEDATQDFRACTNPHAADFLRQVTSLPRQSRVLLTSRLFPRELDGLAGCRREELIGLDPADAVSFFRAHEIRGTRAEIEAACAPYDYLPLALRLLAGMIVRDKRLPGDIKAAPAHPVMDDLKGKQHHILHAASHALDSRKRGLLSRIAAFRSSMDYDALLVFNPYKREETFDAALDELIDRGLLLSPESGRYDLHPIVRQYAYDRLRDKRGVHSQLRDYFAAVPAPEADEVESLDDLAPVIELYHHTVRAGRYDEACELLRDRLVAPLYFRFGAYQTEIELLRALFPNGEDRPPRLTDERAQAWALTALATSCTLSGQSRRAVPLSELGIEIAESMGAKRNVAIGLGNLAQTLLALGGLAVAEQSLRRASELCRHPEDELQEAIGHQQLGRLLSYQGAFDEADEELIVAQPIFDRMGPEGTSFVSVIRADHALRGLLMGEPQTALEAARRARRLADEVAITRYPFERDFIRAEWLLGWALVALASEEPDQQEEHLTEAEKHLTEALTRCRRINMVDHEAQILLAWARWHRLKGNTDEAHRLAEEEALNTADRCEYGLQRADIHNFLARLALDAGEKEAALHHAKTARERAFCDGPPHYYKPAYEEAERLLEEAKRLKTVGKGD